MSECFLFATQAFFCIQNLLELSSQIMLWVAATGHFLAPKARICTLPRCDIAISAISATVLLSRGHIVGLCDLLHAARC